MNKHIERIIEHKIFRLSLYIKGIYGLLETIAGVMLLFASSATISRIVEAIFGRELVSDPDDVMANFFMNAARNMSLHVHQLISVIMIVHGILSIGIMLALMKKKLWVFPVVSSLLALTIIYQIYEFVFNHSIILLIITFVDIAIFALLGQEFHKAKKKSEQ